MRIPSDSIIWRYILAEAIDPFTKQKAIYASEKFKNPLYTFRSLNNSLFEKNKEEFDAYIRNLVSVGDEVEIIISKENPKIYYIVEPVVYKK